MRTEITGNVRIKIGYALICLARKEFGWNNSGEDLGIRRVIPAAGCGHFAG